MIIQVKGDTFQVKDLIKKLGGRWNVIEKVWYFTIENEEKIKEIIKKLNFQTESSKCKATLDKNTIYVRCDRKTICDECGRWIWERDSYRLRDSNGVYANFCEKCYRENYKGTFWWERSWR